MNIIDEILKVRNVVNKEKFLKPNYNDLIQKKFYNEDIAIEEVLNGLKYNKNFTVYYDTDTDGICSGIIMSRYLSNFIPNSNIKIAINEGKEHGTRIDKINLKWTDILIVVDSLNNNYNDYNIIESHGVKVIILDHHIFEKYPINKNVILVSSNQNYDNPYLSGAGVTWKFCMSLDKVINSNYADDLVDLAACGIIGDVSDMSEKSLENRYIATLGFNNLKNKFIKLLLNGKEFNSKSIIWTITPTINASNRMCQNKLPIMGMLSDNDPAIKIIIDELKKVKIDQDNIMSRFYHEALQQVYSQNIINKLTFAILSEKNNFCGIVATKLCELYEKPSIVVYYDDNSEYFFGSIRANNINFLDIINNCKQSGIDVDCKGHQEAAGIKIHINHFVKLIELLNKNEYTSNLINNYDIEINIDDINKNLIKQLDKLNKVSGKNFPSVKLFIKNVKTNNLKILKEKHTKFEFGNIDFICWNNLELTECDCNNDIYVNIIGGLEINSFAGKERIQFIIKEFVEITEIPNFIK